jgi:plasmid stabilization system protein ParE
MRLEWSVLAQADRDTIFDYIEADNPQAAITVDGRIREQAEGLVQFRRAVVVAASREHGSWSFPARPTSPLIVSLATPCGFCVSCTVPSSGPRICPKDHHRRRKIAGGGDAHPSPERSIRTKSRLSGSPVDIRSYTFLAKINHLSRGN